MTHSIKQSLIFLAYLLFLIGLACIRIGTARAADFYTKAPKPQDTPITDDNGNRIGAISPDGSFHILDESGKSIGTLRTEGDTTILYDENGNIKQRLTEAPR